MEMKILESVEVLKDHVRRRLELVNEKKAIEVKIKAGCAFFQQVTPRTSSEDLNHGAKKMQTLLLKRQDIDKQIYELDTVICSRLEAEFLDSVIKIRTKKRQNDAGDTIASAEFFFMPEGYNEEDYATIDERNLWFLKIIKAAFSIQNIDVIKKGQNNE